MLGNNPKMVNDCFFSGRSELIIHPQKTVYLKSQGAQLLLHHQIIFSLDTHYLAYLAHYSILSLFFISS